MDELPLPGPTLCAVLNELIPGRGPSLPGAGDLGLGDSVEAQLADARAAVAAMMDLYTLPQQGHAIAEPRDKERRAECLDILDTAQRLAEFR